MDDKGIDLVFWFNQGGAVALLVLVIVACYRVANWLGSQWLIPLRDAVVSHLHHLDQTLDELMVSMRAQRIAIDELRAVVQKISDERQGHDMQR